MNKDNLARMGSKELDAYAQTMGFSAKGARGAEAKRELIERRRARCAELTVLGVDLSIPVKRAHDKRVVDLMNSKDDGKMMDGMRLLLGDEQFAELVAACTEEDGTSDVAAMAYAVIAITGSDELKNF